MNTAVKQALAIDPNRLDDMLVAQPQLFYEYAEAYSLAVSDRDMLKDKLARTYAETDARLREEAARADEKITEKAIEASVKVDEDYKQVAEQYREACKEADLLAAAKEAFAQRAWVLKELASLYISGYYSTDAVRGNRDSQDVALEGIRKRQSEKRQQLRDSRRERVKC